jgi:predicted amidophosphoribosyltransferase
MTPKWKYGPEARKKRFCSVCGKRLKKDEVVLCSACFAELLNTTVEVEEIKEESEDETEEIQNETD